MLVFFFVYIFFIQKKKKKEGSCRTVCVVPRTEPTARPPPTAPPRPPTPPIPHGLELDENPEPGGFLVLRSSFRLPPKNPRRPPGESGPQAARCPAPCRVRDLFNYYFFAQNTGSCSHP